jgi:hypothetical protein
MHEPIYKSIPPRDRRNHLLPEATVATHPEKKKGNYLFACNGSFSGSEGDDEYAVAVTR